MYSIRCTTTMASLSIASAGNDGTTAPFYPASYPSVISVAAVDQNNIVAGFSQKNDTGRTGGAWSQAF